MGCACCARAHIHSAVESENGTSCHGFEVVIEEGGLAGPKVSSSFSIFCRLPDFKHDANRATLFRGYICSVY